MTEMDKNRVQHQRVMDIMYTIIAVILKIICSIIIVDILILDRLKPSGLKGILDGILKMTALHCCIL